MADRIPKLRDHITLAVRNNMKVGSKRMQEQLRTLLIEPLTTLSNELAFPLRLIVIIDALDECNDRSDVAGLLGLLPKLHSLPEQLQVRILILSRPESHIKAAMPMDMVHPFSLNKIPVHEAKSESADTITLFMTHEIGRITKQQKLEKGWLPTNQLQELIKRSDGLFIYATTICKFLDGAINDRIRAMRVSPILDGKSTTGAPEERLSEIYLKVLAFPGTNLSVEEKTELYGGTRKTFGIIACVFKPISLSGLGDLLGRPRTALSQELDPFHAIVNVPEDDKSPVHFFHLSFHEYLLDRARSWPDFWVDEIPTHSYLFQRCMEIMDAGLRQDICELLLPGF